jgi:hypothetical protein
MTRNEPPQTALERRSARTPTAAILKNRSILADIAVALLEPGDDQEIRRSGSKSGSAGNPCKVGPLPRNLYGVTRRVKHILLGLKN